MSVPQSVREALLAGFRKRIFNTFVPTGDAVKTGRKELKTLPKGPSILNYYRWIKPGSILPGEAPYFVDLQKRRNWEKSVYLRATGRGRPLKSKEKKVKKRK